MDISDFQRIFNKNYDEILGANEKKLGENSSEKPKGPEFYPESASYQNMKTFILCLKANGL